tara:strand:- start:625 stop:1056 length:432 start_codon:yes stop_codon:yes gene_type:complete
MPRRSSLLDHRTAIETWRREGLFFHEIATKLGELGVQTTRQNVGDFCAKVEIRKGPPSEWRAPSEARSFAVGTNPNPEEADQSSEPSARQKLKLQREAMKEKRQALREASKSPAEIAEENRQASLEEGERIRLKERARLMGED